MEKQKRLIAIDILRGITIAGMILVNTPGSWQYIYTPLEHSIWNGLTPTDLIFPFFMFIMGISTYISLKKTQFEFSTPLMWKILKRVSIMWGIGLFISWFAISLYEKRVAEWESVRILGVFQRLAICYGFTAIAVLLIRHKHIPYITASILIGYSMMLILGDGYEYNSTNLLSIVDCTILGENHMYRDNGIDPEGILSTIPSIAHVLIGFCCGAVILKPIDIRYKIEKLFIIGAVLTFSGFLLDYGLPLNKKIWSPSFVLVTTGMASSLLSLLIWIVDVRLYKKWSTFFVVFGVNPLFIYVLATIVSVLFSAPFTIISQYTSYNSIADAVFNYLSPILGHYEASLVYALLFICLIWGIGHILYRKNIYIKI